jgi:hypothetical protein
VFIDHPGCGRRVANNNMVVSVADAFCFADVVVKTKVNPVDVGQISRNVIRHNFNFTVLHIHGFGEQDVVDHMHFNKQATSNNTVKIGSRDQSLFFISYLFILALNATLQERNPLAPAK